MKFREVVQINNKKQNTGYIILTITLLLILFSSTSMIYANQSGPIINSPEAPWWTAYDGGLLSVFSISTFLVPIIELITLLLILFYLKKIYDAIKKP